MKITIDERILKDMVESNDECLIHEASTIARDNILKDIRKTFAKWHIPVMLNDKGYSAIFIAVTSIVDTAIDEYIAAQLDQEPEATNEN